MNKKNLKFIILNSLVIFILASASHFIYGIFNNSITAIFFLVNESIFEHMKLLYTPYLIDTILLYILFQKTHIVYHNLLFSSLFSSIFSIFLFLSIYLPIYTNFKVNLVFDISLLFIVILISQFVQLYILKKETSNKTNLSLISIILIYVIFGYLTYYPFKNYIFYDFNNNMYGRNIYILGN